MTSKFYSTGMLKNKDRLFKSSGFKMPEIRFLLLTGCNFKLKDSNQNPLFVRFPSLQTKLRPCGWISDVQKAHLLSYAHHHPYPLKMILWNATIWEYLKHFRQSLGSEVGGPQE